MPDVEGGIFAARTGLDWHKVVGTPVSVWFRERLASAGLGSPALQQARMPAATTEPKQLDDLHFEVKGSHQRPRLRRKRRGAGFRGEKPVATGCCLN